MIKVIFFFVITFSLTACISNPVKSPQASPAPIEEYPALVSEVQVLLNQKGYNAGQADGIAGPKTRGAIKKYEEANNLPVDGLIDEALYAALKQNDQRTENPQNSNPMSNATPAEQQLRSESEFFNRTGWQACAISGGGVGLAVLLITKDKGKALASAVVACGVGMGANYYLQQRRQQYSNKEQRLEQMIADVRADNQRLSRVIQSADEVITEDKKRIDEIDKAYKQKQMTMDQAHQEMQSVDNNRAYLEQTLANLKKREAEWIQVADAERDKQSKADMAAIDREINQLQKQIASLESDLEILVNRRSVSPIG